MPRRSNAFQDLVALIEGQLAPLGATVHESHLLEDATTGEDREVDVVIEIEAGIHPVVIGIEVTDQKRPASSTWIEGIAQKHADLPINKTIAVSRSGFYRPAIQKARGLKIEVLTVEEATELDWQAKIDSMPFVHIESFLMPFLTEATLLFADAASPHEFEGIELSNLILYRPTGESRGTLKSILDRFLARRDVLETLSQKAFDDGVTIVEGEFRTQEGSYVLAGAEAKHLVTRIAFKAKCKKEIDVAELQKGRYGDVAVALASGESFGQPVRLAFSQKPGEDPLVSMRIYKPKEL